MFQYQRDLASLISQPVVEDRTGVGTRGTTFGHAAYNLRMGASFPAVTTKKLAIVPVIGELLGFIRGATSAAEFRELGCNVWNANANEQTEEGLPDNAWLVNPWREGEDDLGRIYGAQWRAWEDVKIVPAIREQEMVMLGYDHVTSFDKDEKEMDVWRREIDQLSNVIEALTENPSSRRAVVSAWNVGDMERMALPPCHVLFQFLCKPLDVSQRVEALILEAENEAIWNKTSRDAEREDILKRVAEKFGSQGPTHEWLDHYNAPRFRLDINMYQRSADYVLGAPFNIASYAALNCIVARILNAAPGTLNHITGDTHVYANHTNAAREQLRREPTGETPRLIINPELKTLADFEQATPDDFRLFNYHHRGKLRTPTPMAI